MNVITQARVKLRIGELSPIVNLSCLPKRLGAMRKKRVAVPLLRNYPVSALSYRRNVKSLKGLCSSSKPADSKAKPERQMRIYKGVAACPT